MIILVRKFTSILLIICFMTQNVLASSVAVMPNPVPIGNHLPAHYKAPSQNTAIVPADTNIGMDRAANGVPVVNINAPNGAGVSHNQFQDFNVGERGVILNNSRSEGRSELGGIVLANPNMVHTSSANTIINEVISNRASSIRGATEIFGQRADYILANPNGINVNGGEFINIGRAILTTGIPELNASGGLEKILVDKGTISFSKDLDLMGLDYFDVISRVAKINAKLHVHKELKVITGRNEYNVRTKEVNTLASDGSKPSLAIDSYNLGGLYAGKITIVSTEDGVGVHLGDMASKVQEITVTSNGEIKHKNLKSNTDIDLKSNAGVLIARDSEVGARGSIKYEAAKAMNNDGGKISALGSNGVIISSGEIYNTGIVSARDILINTTGNLDNLGLIKSKSKLIANIGANITNHSIISAEDGILSINTGGNLLNTKHIISKSQNLHMNVGSNLENQGTILAKYNLHITSSGHINNSTNAVINSKEAMLDITSNSYVTNNGAIQSRSALNIDAFGNVYNGPNDKQNGDISSRESRVSIKSQSGSVNNDGRIISKENIVLKTHNSINNNFSGVINGASIDLTSGRDINNSGKIIGEKSGVIINSQNDMINSGDIIAQTELNIKSLGNISNINQATFASIGSSLDINSETGYIINTGSLISEGLVAIKAKENIRNGGAVVASNAIIFKAGSNILNEGSISSSNSSVVISSGSAVNNIGGLILARDLVHINSKGFVLNEKTSNNNDSGVIISKQNKVEIITDTNIENNNGTIFSAENLKLSANNISNTGAITALGKIEIKAKHNLTNEGTIKSENRLHIKSKGDMVNNGTIESPAPIYIESARGLINDVQGTIESGSVLNLTIAKDIENKGNLLAHGTDIAIETKQDVINTGRIGGEFSSIKNITAVPTATTTTNPASHKGGHLEITTKGNFINSGIATTAIAENIYINAGDINNNNGLITAKNNLELGYLGNITNNAGKINTQNTLLIASSTGSLDNTDGTITANDTAIINISGDIGNNSGLIEAKEALQITSFDGTLNNTRGRIKSGDTSKITVKGDIINNFSGVVESIGDTVIISNSGHMQNNQGIILSGGELQVKTAGEIDNKKGHIESKKSLKILSQTGGLDNTKGEIVAGENASMKLAGDVLNEDGAIQAEGKTDITSSAGGFQNTKGKLVSVKELEVTVKGNIDNGALGLIESGNNMVLTSITGAVNNSSDILSGDGLNINSPQKVQNNTPNSNIQSIHNLVINSPLGVENGNIISSKHGAVTIDVLGAGNIVNHIGARIESGLKMFLKTNTGSIDQRGSLVSKGGLELRQNSTFDNKGVMSVDGGVLDVQIAGNFTNSNKIYSGYQFNFNSTNGAFANNGTITLNGHSASITAPSGIINNVNGFINGAVANLLLSSPSNNIQNLGEINITGGINTNSRDFTNSGFISASQGGRIAAANQINNSNYINFYGGSMSLDTPYLYNNGNIAGTNLSVNSATINNTKALFGESSVNITAGTMTNGGIIVGSGNVTGRFTGSLTNNNLFLARHGILDLSSDGPITNSGVLNSANSLSITGSNINNTNSIAARNNLNVTARGDLTNNGSITSYGDETITAGSLNNYRTLEAKGRLLANISGNMANGGNVEAGYVYLSLGGDLNNSGHKILSGSSIDIRAKNVNNRGGTIASMGGGININATIFNQAADINVNKITYEDIRSGRKQPNTGNIDHNDGNPDYANPRYRVISKTYIETAPMSSGVSSILSANGPIYLNVGTVYSVGSNISGHNVASLQHGKDAITLEKHEWRVRDEGRITNPRHRGRNFSGERHRAWSTIKDEITSVTIQHIGANITAHNNIAIGISSKNYSEPAYGVDRPSGRGAQVSPSNIGIGVSLQDRIKSAIVPSSVSDLAKSAELKDRTADATNAPKSLSEIRGQITLDTDDLASKVRDFASMFSARKTLPKPEDYSSSYLPDPHITEALEGLSWMEPDAPGIHYITETSIVFTDKSKYFGTADFIERIPGYDPRKDNTAGGASYMHLGDSMKQHLFVQRQMIDLTGLASLEAGYDPTREMMKLYDNAHEAARDLKLTPGITLSKSQVAQLKEDMVWPEEIKIDSQNVMVPRLYLAKSRRAEKFNGMIAGGTIDIEQDEITHGNTMLAQDIRLRSTNGNTRIFGEVKATRSVVIDSSGDTEIDGGNVYSGGNIFTTSRGDLRNVRGTMEAVHRMIAMAGGSVENRGGEFKSGGDSFFVAGRDVSNIGGEFKTGRDMTLVAGRDVANITEVTRIGDSNNYVDILEKKAEIKASGDLLVKAGGDFVQLASDVRARNIDMDIAGNGEIGAQALASRSHSGDIGNSEFFSEGASNYNTLESVRHATSSMLASGSVNIATGGNFALLGSGLEAVKDISIRAGGSARVESLVEMDHSESHREESDDSFLGLDGDSVEHFSSHEERLVKSSIASGRGLRVESGGEQVYRGAEIGSGGRTSIVAPRIEFLAERIRSGSSSYSNQEGRFWQSMESSGTSSSDVVEASVMAKGGFVLDTKEGVFVEVVPEGSSLAASLQGASLSSSSGLNRGPIIHYSTVHPTHDAWHDSHSGLVPEVAMVVKFIGSYFGGIVGGEALVSAINNKGDISKVGKDMTSKETLRRMGTDLAVAVAMQGLTDAASLGDVSKFTGNARIGAIAGREAIMAGTSAVIRGEKLETALRGAAFATGLGVVQMKVGDVGVSAGLSEGGLVKTAMHASVGGIFAEATGSEFKYGAIAGGVGELAAGHLAPKESEAGKRLVGTISAASVLAAGGNINDMSKASHTAESAVEYNSWGHVARAVIGTIAKKVATKSTKEVAKKATTEGVKETVKSAVKQEVKQATSSATRAAVKESTQDATKTLTKAEKRGISKEYKAEVKAKDKAREVLQGNNKDLKKPTHVYKIYEKETSVKDKIGESAGKVREDGKSLRAESQVNKKNKEAGYDKYRSKIMRVYEDKRTGRKFETKWIEKVKEQDGHSALPGNKNNR